MSESNRSRYAHIIDLVREQPWALLPEKLAAIVSLLHLREAGVTLTEQDIRARIGSDRPSRRELDVTDSGIGVLPVYGVLAQRMDLMSAMSGGTSTERLTAEFRVLRDDPKVRAIVLDVDSPGGGVYGIDELATEIRAARGIKPIVAVANSIAGSAAYWLASQADEFASTPGGAVGSIGIFVAHQDLSQSLEKAGVRTTLISAGAYKTEGNPFTPLSDEARAAIQDRVDHAYARFVQAVALGRKVGEDRVRSGYGKGRVLDAAHALHAGMIDRVATLDEEVERLERRLGPSASSARSVRAAATSPAIGTPQEPERATGQDRLSDALWLARMEADMLEL